MSGMNALILFSDEIVENAHCFSFIIAHISYLVFDFTVRAHEFVTGAPFKCGAALLLNAK